MDDSEQEQRDDVTSSRTTARGDLNSSLNKNAGEQAQVCAGRRGAREAHVAAVAQGAGRKPGGSVMKPAKPRQARCFSCMPFLASTTRPAAPDAAGAGTVTGNVVCSPAAGDGGNLHAVPLEQRISD